MSSPQRLQVLAVDLDHTLIDTDMIYFGLKQIFLKKIYIFPYLFYLLLFRGKPTVKKYLYNNSIFDVNKIPFNEDLIKYIKKERENYNHVILISGSYHKYVETIANYLMLFDSYVGTCKKINMISDNKLLYLNTKFNNPIFDYIGDNKKDIIIWESCRNALVVDHGNITKHIKHLEYKVISKRY